LEWEKVSLIFSYFENASYFTKISPLCIENDSPIFNSHARKFKQKSSNKVGVYKDCPPMEYLRHKIVGASTKTFQPYNVYKIHSYDKTTNKRFQKEMVETYHTHKRLFAPPLYGMN
jgi:hypothetical protein